MHWFAFAALMVLLPVYIAAEYRSHSRRLHLCLKTACSVLFCAAAVLAAGRGGWPSGSALMLAAFGCSLIGDVLLALPQRYFLPGLCAFFAAQCLFAAGFCARLGVDLWDMPLWAVVAAVTLWLLLRKPGMHTGQMSLPACAYALALSAMAAKSVSGLYLGFGAQAVVAAAGGMLFYCSDVVLGLDKFGSTHPKYMTALNLATYYAGQGLLAVSLAL